MYVDTDMPFLKTYVSTFYIICISTWTFFHPKNGQKGAFCQLPVLVHVVIVQPLMYIMLQTMITYFFPRDDHRLLYLSLKD